MQPIPFQTLIPAATGIVRAVETAGRLRFERFDDLTLDYYQTLNTARYERALCSAGIALAFRTDSSRLSFAFELDVTTRNYSFIDVVVDGLFIATAGAAAGPDRIEADLVLPGAPGALRSVTLYLPHCRRALLERLALTDGASFEPAPSGRPILLALGDSITQGMNAHHPSLTYAAVMARALGLSLHNQGVGGHVFDVAGLCARPLNEPSLITVAYGVNDWNQGREMAEALPWLRRLRDWYPTAPLAVFEPIWGARDGIDVNPAPNSCGKLIQTCRQELADMVAGIEGARIVPFDRLLPTVTAFLPDGVHPDDAGHIVYGQNAATVLASIFPHLTMG